MPNSEKNRFQQLYSDNGFWSCLGYDGLSVAFDLPLDTVRCLPEEPKRALVGLITHLAKPEGEALRNQVRTLDSLNSEERLARLMHLCAPFRP
jgi:hypothetical protein